MKTLTLAFGITLIASNMAHADAYEHDMSQHRKTMQTASREVKHEGSGVLKAVNLEAGKVQIAHQPIEALGWPAMTMWFALRSPLPQDTKVGDSVRFELEQTQSKDWVITRIERKR
ncbi:MAG TPA: copper-binding protein [Gallionella sp.]|nr:copper-binding protein [Gallionella sp.]